MQTKTNKQTLVQSVLDTFGFAIWVIFDTVALKCEFKMGETQGDLPLVVYIVK